MFSQEAVRRISAPIWSKILRSWVRLPLVQHEIRLTNNTPFNEGYRRIPPHQYEEVRKHLQEMLDIGAIHRSTSPWASPVVLVHKKDGSLQFCIDLRKLNNQAIKDAQSLPRIEDYLNCLDGATIFTSLDLQSGYWQVEMTEDNKPLRAFTVGPLGFYRCSDAIWFNQCPSHIPAFNGNLFGGKYI